MRRGVKQCASRGTVKLAKVSGGCRCEVCRRGNAGRGSDGTRGSGPSCAVSGGSVAVKCGRRVVHTLIIRGSTCNVKPKRKVSSISFAA